MVPMPTLDSGIGPVSTDPSALIINEVLYGQYQWDKWLEKEYIDDDTVGDWKWKNMDTEHSILFNRLLLKWGSSPGFAGAMGGGAMGGGVAAGASSSASSSHEAGSSAIGCPLAMPWRRVPKLTG